MYLINKDALNCMTDTDIDKKPKKKLAGENFAMQVLLLNTYYSIAGNGEILHSTFNFSTVQLQSCWLYLLSF